MEQLIFIHYMNRSGSTYLCNQLSEFNEILVCPEAEVLIYNFLINPGKKIKIGKRFFKKIEHIVNYDPKLKYWGLNADQIISRISESNTHFQVFYAFIKVYQEIIKPGAKILVFKGTRLINVLPKVQKSQPPVGIKNIFIIRDPRAIYYSQNRTSNPVNGKRMCNNPVLLAKQWDWYINQIDRYKKDPFCQKLFYEKMILNKDKYILDLCNFLAVNPNQKVKGGDLLRRIPENQLVIHKNSVNQAEKRLIDHWQNEDPENLKWTEIIQKYSQKYLDHYSEFNSVSPITFWQKITVLIYLIRWYLYLVFYKYSYNRYS